MSAQVRWGFAANTNYRQIYVSEICNSVCNGSELIERKKRKKNNFTKGISWPCIPHLMRGKSQSNDQNIPVKTFGQAEEEGPQRLRHQ